ncbi:hypothetical protein [Desulfoluna spongiiphila]|uniref:Uncharacterized protein n=1 Tax=Desulfoluna spongiiphila TaxID=419481 RepID=A0A1G5IF42_9BACT|nr:hypothetical protein [Desulfoluna spongiiphila]SCY74623.1 hypothetical protein SAMN05216233_11991 [Desulfoluna spongiiphila]VVS95442.1 hypothetical protein DBB_50190 [Desulfoluna spongiiphila]
MTLKKLGLILLVFACTACSSQEYSYPVHFETLLNDHSILTFDVTVVMKNEKGLEELKKKVAQVEYGMRIVLTQRHPDQIDTPKRIKSVMRKICESQMANRVDRFDVTQMRLRRYVGGAKYVDEGPKGISRKGLTGQ